MASVDLLRIRDTWANVRANLSNEKLAILSDDDETLVLGNGTDIKKLLVYSNWNGVVQSVVKTGTKIYTEGTTTGLANQQLDLALKELKDNKIEVDNGTATGILSVEDIDASGQVSITASGDANNDLNITGGNYSTMRLEGLAGDSMRMSKLTSDSIYITNNAKGGAGWTKDTTLNYSSVWDSTANTTVTSRAFRVRKINPSSTSASELLSVDYDGKFQNLGNMHIKPDGSNERLYVSDSRVQLNGTDGVSGFVFNTTGGADFYQDLNMGSGTELDTISGDFLIRRNTTSPSQKSGLLNIVGTAGDSFLLLQYHDGTDKYSVQLNKEV